MGYNYQTETLNLENIHIGANFKRINPNTGTTYRVENILNSQESELNYTILKKKKIIGNIVKGNILFDFWCNKRERHYQLVSSGGEYFILKSPSGKYSSREMILHSNSKSRKKAEEKFLELKGKDLH